MTQDTHIPYVELALVSMASHKTRIHSHCAKTSIDRQEATKQAYEGIHLVLKLRV